MNGFINLLKPPGMSSGTAVAIVKRLTGERVGHAGTLDPAEDPQIRAAVNALKAN